MNKTRLYRVLLLVPVLQISIITSFTYAQTTQINKYLSEAEDYNLIYSGELEWLYSSLKYLNTPYYVSDEYETGDLYYRGCYYANQKMRIDLYRNNLILLTKGSNHGIVVNPNYVEKIKLHDKDIIWHIPSENTNLKNGYYTLLVDGSKMKLLEKTTVQLNTPTDRITYDFSFNTRYYLLYKKNIIQ
ncbi:MAG: hypothetical protein LUH22_16615 [Bacteroides sp.]|nr:hypothetical protein [Bacteroides sp.]